jgi:hypothetical protein
VSSWDVMGWFLSGSQPESGQKQKPPSFSGAAVHE